MSNDKVYVFDFTVKRPSTSTELLTSKTFKEIVDNYIYEQKKKQTDVYEFIKLNFGNNQSEKLTNLCQLLLKTSYIELQKSFEYLSNKQVLLKIADGLYDQWRKNQRYVLLEDSLTNDRYELLEAIDRFSRLVISTYRDVYENILGTSQRIYRELPSGANAGFLITKTTFDLPNELSAFNNSFYIKSMMIKPPFLVHTKSNTRKGVFKEKNNPITKIDSNNYLSIGVKIGGSLGLCYLSKKYLDYVIGIGNLFELATPDEANKEKPEFYMIFGYEDEHIKECYYYKLNDGTYVGVCPDTPEIDYFGYVKKMILTLHNLNRINNNELPIHGAGIKIKKTDGTSIVFAILGDSGAGKSETLEALKSLNYDEVADVVTLFDDMGTMVNINGKLYIKGTETGAFVRLDDLDKSYSIKSIDRAIYFNPESINSRLVIPMSTYLESSTLYPIDAFLLADNYSEGETLIKYTDKEKAIADFIEGKRMTMQTTSEKGIVSTFFANPFGPVQEEEKTRKIIESFFEILYKTNVKVLRIRTRLSYERKEGPEKAAKEIYNELIK